MKKRLTIPFCYLFSFALLFSIKACKKSETESTGSNFFLVYDGVQYTTSNHFASKGSELVLQAIIPDCPINTILFRISSNDIGTYDLTSGNNEVNINAGSEQQIFLGTLTLTSNSGYQVSGNFSVRQKNSSGAVREISGGFNNMPVSP